jgi:arylsulfatase A-like enzyme
MTQTTSSPTKQPNQNWRTLIILTVYSAYFYAFMEWLFFVTKPSSLSTLSLLDKLEVFLITGGVVALTMLVCLLILALPALLISHPVWRPRLQLLSNLVPAIVLGITALIMLDNFTYTVLKFGIISAQGIWRIVYAVGFVILIAWITLLVQRRVRKRRTPASYFALGLLTLSGVLILSVALTQASSSTIKRDPLKASATRPNILYLMGDGLNAQYLSLYGYHHDTTPFIKEMAKTSLLAENAFTNVSGTTGSTTSILTGKESAVTKVYRYPDVLTGDASFQHFPGILKREGYETVEIGTAYYLDAQELNLLDGFDIVNSQPQNQLVLNAVRSTLGNSPSVFFISTIIGRARERVFHIFFIQDMVNPLQEVYNPKIGKTDQQRVQEIFDLLDHARQPVFVFAYFIDTHGPNFAPDKQVFATKAESEAWNQGQYEDSILSFDGSVKQIYDHLAQTGQLDNTIIVVSTDHGYKYTTFNRIPIMMHFPKDAHAGTREHNTQLIDIPVTLLDYLGISKPEWMSGMSFLNNETPIERQIISVTAASPTKIQPPFYQIKTLQVQVCQRTYTLNVEDNTWITSIPIDYVAPCNTKTLPSDDEIRKKILDYLKNHDYDISSLQ